MHLNLVWATFFYYSIAKIYFLQDESNYNDNFVQITSSNGKRSLSSSFNSFHLAIRGGINFWMYSYEAIQIGTNRVEKKRIQDNTTIVKSVLSIKKNKKIHMVANYLWWKITIIKKQFKILKQPKGITAALDFLRCHVQNAKQKLAWLGAIFASKSMLIYQE